MANVRVTGLVVSGCCTFVPTASAPWESFVSSGFPTDFKEMVRSRTDLVALVGVTVSLTPQRGGSDYVGLCPFHDDHNPSFHVYPERQSYRCWVCDEGGDCFSFMMKTDGCSFRESLEMLAERAGLEMPTEFRRGTPGEQQNRNRLLEVLAWAENEFHQYLLTSPEAGEVREYLKQRKMTAETVTGFRVGYHPENWEWLLDRARNRFTVQELFAARLVRERRDGSGYRDDFVGRVMFPIHDERGRAVAFGGRVLPGHGNADAPKYLNSPESVVFSKSRLLYGLDVAREEIRRCGTVVVVEGYTDCIMAHQHGLLNVVGTLGTALNETHVIRLKRTAKQVVLVFDGDEAGQNAAERALAKFLAHDVDLRILTLPAGTDPADYLTEHGPDGFRRLLETTVEAWEQKLKLSIDRHGLQTVDARARVLDEILDVLSRVPRLAGTIRENLILSRLVHQIGVAERSIRRRLSELRKTHAGRTQSSLRVDAAEQSERIDLYSGRQSRDDRMERDLLEMIFAAPTIIGEVRGEIAANEFRNRPLRQLLETCYALADRGIEPSYDRVTAVIEDSELKRLAVQIDHVARDKEIARRLEEDSRNRAMDAQRSLLTQAIFNLKWRHKSEAHEASKGQQSQQTDPADGSEADVRARLRRAAEFHRERIAKNTSS